VKGLVLWGSTVGVAALAMLFVVYPAALRAVPFVVALALCPVSTWLMLRWTRTSTSRPTESQAAAARPDDHAGQREAD
jgi:uncharacterized membrane protein